MKMNQFVQGAAKMALCFLMVGSSELFASVKVRGGGGDYNLRLLEAKQMARDMIVLFNSDPSICSRFLNESQCSFLSQNATAMAESLSNSLIIPAEKCFDFDYEKQVLTDIKAGEKGTCFADFFPNDKMMTTLNQSGAPIFVNINQTLGLDVGILSKLFIHESFHHLGLSDQYQSGIEGNLPDKGAEVIYGFSVISNGDFLTKVLQSRNFSGPGLDESQKFQLVWTEVQRGDPKGLGFKAHDRMSISTMFSPAPEFYVELAFCNRTSPIQCQEVIDLRDHIKIVRNNKMDSFEDIVNFTGEQINRAYHQLHARVMTSGDPAGHDLRFRLVEDDFAFTDNRKLSKKEYFAEAILPLESLYTGIQNFKIKIVDKDHQGLSGKNTGASAKVELRLAND